jgi:hypothetical protein
MEVSGKRYAPAALSSGKNPRAHCTGGWVDPRVGLDILEEKNHLLPLLEYEPRLVSP